jgi:hypothetical protein
MDPPAAQRRASRRDEMLSALRGPGLLLTPPPGAARGQQDAGHLHAAAPPQVTLNASMGAQEARAAMAVAGVGYPCLVKPLSTAPAAPPAAAPTSRPIAARVPDALGKASMTAAAQPSHGGLEANHVMGALFSDVGLESLLSGELPALAPPVVVQQFVPHGERIFKVCAPCTPPLLCSDMQLQQPAHCSRAAPSHADNLPMHPPLSRSLAARIKQLSRHASGPPAWPASNSTPGVRYWTAECIG